MKFDRSSVLFFLSLLALPLAACDGGSDDTGEEDLDVADASFSLASVDDCTNAFASRQFLQRLAADRGWGDEEITAFCSELDEIKTTYAEDATLTLVTVAGVGQFDGGSFESAYYIGASGYNLTEIRAWLAEARASRAARRCTRQVRQTRRRGDALEEGFMGDCLEDTTGSPYPEPIFQEARSSVTIDEVGETAAGIGASLAIYNVPDTGTVVSFLAGAFYAQAEPAYGAFIGCGVAIGFEDVGEEGGEADVAGSYVCVGAEY